MVCREGLDLVKRNSRSYYIMRVRIQNLCYLHRRFKAAHGSVSNFVLMNNFFILRFFYNINAHIQRWHFCVFAPSTIVESRERLNLLNQPSFHALFRTRVSKLFCKRPDRQYFHMWILLQLLNSAACMHKQTHYYKQT